MTKGKYIYINNKTGETIDTDMEEEDALDLLPDTDFAQSLKKQYKEKDGALSETQKFWIMKLAMEREEHYPCETAELLKVLQNSDRITIKYKDLDIDLRLYQNGSIWYNGNRIGIYKSDGLRVKGTVPAKVVNQFLLRFTREPPTECFDKIGKRTGICCYCGIELTHPISVELGRGPVCSDTHGLPFPWDRYRASLKEARKETG